MASRGRAGGYGGRGRGGQGDGRGRGDGGGRGPGQGRGRGDYAVRPAAPAPRQAAPPAIPAAGADPRQTASAASSSSRPPPHGAAMAVAASALARDVGRLSVEPPAAAPGVRPQAPAPSRVAAPASRPQAPAPSPMAAPVIRPHAPAPSPAAPPVGRPQEAASSSAAAPVGQPQPPTLPEPLPVSSKGLDHAPRPGYGTLGRPVKLRANHFLVGFAENDLCHYDVAINPEPKTKRTNRTVISVLVKNYKATSLGGKILAYDGSKSMYSAGELPFKSMDFVVKLGRDQRETVFKVTIKHASRPDLYHLQQFINARHRESPQDAIQALDIVLRETPSQNYVTVARSFFSTDFGQAKDIGDGLECWRGYYQSLRPTQMGLSLNIDISSTSFYKPIMVTQFVEDCLIRTDPKRPLSDRDRLKLKKLLRGIRVETTHQTGKTSIYKISGITTAPLNQLNFPLDEGTQMTVVQYFWDRYKYRLQYSSWPCLQAGNESRPIYLPMEVCKIMKGQRYTKKLNDKQVTNILRATCERPRDREQSILTMVGHNNYAGDKMVNEFALKVTDKMATVNARVLPPPMLKYHDSGREKTCEPSVGQWNMINKKMINGGNVQSWTCLNFSRMRLDAVHGLCEGLVNMCNSIGMAFNPRPAAEVRSANPNTIESTLKDVHNRAPNLQLLIVILPDVKGYYGKIKKVCETDLGIVSQCLAPAKASRANNQYLENVALKINVKVGGRNTVLQRALVPNGIPFLNDRPTIVFGADVTHPSPGEDSSPSIAAVVASMDWPQVTQYRALVSSQHHRNEIIEDLYRIDTYPDNVVKHGGMIRELLIAFKNKTGHKPQRIIFYRDGVSDGQFNQVLLREMDAIRKACQSLQEGYLPPVTFVIVQKRHHTRLFPEVHGRRDLTDKSGNILAGTVVDTTICHPSEFDFFLCSHAGIQGTSRPTHYHVLYDENKFTADSLQMLTNSLCYTYARCTRSVSVVPPAYYAHLAAFRARYYDEPSEESDGASTVVSGGGAAGPLAAVRSLPQVKENVKDVMFYC